MKLDYNCISVEKVHIRGSNPVILSRSFGVISKAQPVTTCLSGTVITGRPRPPIRMHLITLFCGNGPLPARQLLHNSDASASERSATNNDVLPVRISL